MTEVVPSCSRKTQEILIKVGQRRCPSSVSDTRLICAMKESCHCCKAILFPDRPCKNVWESEHASLNVQNSKGLAKVQPCIPSVKNAFRTMVIHSAVCMDTDFLWVRTSRQLRLEWSTTLKPNRIFLSKAAERLIVFFSCSIVNARQWKINIRDKHMQLLLAEFIHNKILKNNDLTECWSCC